MVNTKTHLPADLSEVSQKVKHYHIKLARILKGHPIGLFKDIMKIFYEALAHHGTYIPTKERVLNREDVVDT